MTRDSLLTLAAAFGSKIEERPISTDELEKAFHNKTITEAFGVGTAAVVAPIGVIGLNDVDHHLPEYSHESLMNKLKLKLDRIRIGEEEDVYGWNYIL